MIKDNKCPGNQCFNFQTLHCKYCIRFENREEIKVKKQDYFMDIRDI